VQEGSPPAPFESAGNMAKEAELPFVMQLQGPRSGFSSGGANDIALALVNEGDPGACSPGKI